MATQESHYQVSNMKCEGCIARAKEALGGVPGFVEATFDLRQGSARVVGNVDPLAVAQALSAVGYPAVPSDPSDRA